MSYFGKRSFRYSVSGPVRAILRISCVLPILAAQLGTIVLLDALPYGRLRSSLLTFGTRVTGRTFLWFFRFHISVRGTPPPGGSVIVGNHISWIDAFLYAAVLGCRFIAIHWIHEIPLLRNALRTLSVEIIHKAALRDLPRLNGVLDEVSDSDRSLLFFPEATTLRGDRVYPFHAALLENAAQRRRPVYWTVISYRISVPWVPAGLVIPWFDWTPLILHAYRIGHIPKTLCTVRFGTQPVVGTDRRAVAQELERRVSDAFVSLSQPSQAVIDRFYRRDPATKE